MIEKAEVVSDILGLDEANSPLKDALKLKHIKNSKWLIVFLN